MIPPLHPGVAGAEPPHFEDSNQLLKQILLVSLVAGTVFAVTALTGGLPLAFSITFAVVNYLVPDPSLFIIHTLFIAAIPGIVMAATIQCLDPRRVHQPFFV